MMSALHGLLRRLLITFALVATIGVTLGQGIGSVSGVVEDPSGARIARAEVTARNIATDGALTVRTSDLGTFFFPSLLIGRYEIRVSQPSFKPAIAPNVVVDAGLIATVTIKLELPGLTAGVTVVEDAQQAINTVTPELTNIIDPVQMMNLPLPERNPGHLIRLQAGVATPNALTLNAAKISGLRGNTTDVTVDGIDYQFQTNRAMPLFWTNFIGGESTGEISVTTGTAGLDSGKGANRIKLVTPTGTTQLHGSLFEIHANKVFNANEFFSNQSNTPRPALIKNIFGGSLGGPVVIPKVYDGQRRTFFFTAMTFKRIPKQFERNRTVWTSDARNGIFQYTDTGGNLRQVNLLQVAPNFKSINPLTKELLDQTPFPNNNDVGDGLNTGGFRFLSKAMESHQILTLRVDHRLADRLLGAQHDLEFVVHNDSNLYLPDTFAMVRDAAFPGGQNLSRKWKDVLAGIALHSTFGPHLHNELRVGLGAFPGSTPRDTDFPGTMIITFPIGTSPQESTRLSSGGRESVNHLRDNVSWQAHNHIFKFGAEVYSRKASNWDLDGTVTTVNLGSNTSNPDGLLQSMFPGGPSNAAFTNARAHYALLVGLLNNATRTFNVANFDVSPTFVPGAPSARAIRYREWGAYLSDQWRWRPNFTWNFGLRYDMLFPPKVVAGGVLVPENGLDSLFGISGRDNLFNPGVMNGSPVNNLVLGGPQAGRPFWNLDKNNFAPFVGFAFQPRFDSGPGKWLLGSGRTSIRGGYSISYTRDSIDPINQIATANQGLLQRVTTPALTGVLGPSGVSITPPDFKVPISDVETYTRTSGAGGFWAIDPNLRTPYVQQWSFGIERELPGRVALEVRYVGNHAQAMLRGLPYVNEVNIFENGFLQEFSNAQRNLQTNGGTTFAPGAAGTVPLPVFTTLFAGLPAGSGFANSNLINLLNTGQAGGMASTLSSSTTYQANRANLAANFFKANPNLAFARYETNASHSTYNALQVEARRRFSTGFFVQANYTFSKTLTDGETELTDPYKTIRNPQLAKHLADWDVAHTFNASYVYDLPFGRGRRFYTSIPVVGAVLDGWGVSGLLSWHAGPHKTITTGTNPQNGRLTFNQVSSMVVPIGDAVETIRNNTGIYRRPEGVFWLNPDLLNITVNPATGLATSSTLKPGLFRFPEAGEVGYLGETMFKAPSFFQTDLSIRKKTRVSESANVEFRVELFNAFNNANFNSREDTVLDSQQFGRIVDTFVARTAQLSLRLNW